MRKTSRVLIRCIVLTAAVAGGSAFQVGCITPSTSMKVFVDSSFTAASLHRIAIFPIVHRRLTLSDAEQLYRDLVQSIHKKNPSIEVIDIAEVMRVLNEKGLTAELARFLDVRDARGLPDSTALKRIGRTLGVSAVFQGEIQEIKQTDGVFRHNKGITSVTMRYYLIGVESGKLLWDVSTEGVLVTWTSVEPALPIIDAIKLAHPKVLERLPF